MAEFDSSTHEKLRVAYDRLPKVQRPDYYLMNWTMWCKARRVLKERGITVEYILLGHHRGPLVNGVEVKFSEFITEEGIYELTLPPFSLDMKPRGATVYKYPPDFC